MTKTERGRRSEGCSGRVLLRAGLVAALAASLCGCAVFFGGNKAESAPAAAVSPAGIGAADPGDPVPRNEPPHPTANKWYGANGKLFRPFTDDREFKERGKASIIAPDHEGQPTASGEPFTARALTAAHSRLPIPSYARVTNLRTSRTTIVRVNDRGAYDRDEAIGISVAAARKIGLAEGDEVEVERITPAEIAAMPASRATTEMRPVPAPPAAQAPAPPPAVAVAAQVTPPPAETTPLPPQPAAPASAPAPVAALEPAPVSTPAPAPVDAAPAATARAPRGVPAPVAAAPAPAAAKSAAPRAPARASSSQSSPTGRWSVQVAAFATDSLAESTRARIAKQLAANAPALAEADRTPRVERRGNRSYVLVGDFADRDAAEALAGRLRAVLRQDVVVDRY